MSNDNLEYICHEQNILKTKEKKIMAYNVNDSHIKISYKIMDNAGYLLGTGYEILCKFDELSLVAYKDIMKDMIHNYFTANLGNTKLVECSVINLRLLLGCKESSKERKDMEEVLKKIISFCKGINPNMSLAELLLGMEIIV